VIGPVLGGLILSVSSWRWIFFINVPIGILGALWGYIALKEMSSRGKAEKFDLIGALSFSIGLVSILLSLTAGINLGWFSAPVLGMFALFFIMLAVFFWWERRAASPVLDFTLFKDRVYNFSVLAAMMQSLAMFAVNFLVIFYLQGVRGYDPLHAALLLIPLPIVSSILAPISGILADRIGARLPATLGLIIQAIALVWFAQITPTTAYWQIAIGLGFMGIGGGLFYSPNTSAAMNSAPKARLGVASATRATLRQVGMVTSFALAMAVSAASLPQQVMLQLFVGTNVALGSSVDQAFVIGMHSAFHVSLVLCVLAAGISWVRGKENRREKAAAEGFSPS
jgi:EmrB/QacA subfamily drug resistance transporter